VGLHKARGRSPSGVTHGRRGLEAEDGVVARSVAGALGAGHGPSLRRDKVCPSLRHVGACPQKRRLDGHGGARRAVEPAAALGVEINHFEPRNRKRLLGGGEHGGERSESSGLHEAEKAHAVRGAVELGAFVRVINDDLPVQKAERVKVGPSSKRPTSTRNNEPPDYHLAAIDSDRRAEEEVRPLDASEKHAIQERLPTLEVDHFESTVSKVIDAKQPNHRSIAVVPLLAKWQIGSIRVMIITLPSLDVELTYRAVISFHLAQFGTFICLSHSVGGGGASFGRGDIFLKIITSQ